MAKKPTVKERKLVKGIARGKSITQAALDAYDTTSPDSAKAIGSRALTKVNVQEAFAAYKPFKEALCKQLALKWQSEIDQRLFNAMMNWQIHQI